MLFCESSGERFKEERAVLQFRKCVEQSGTSQKRKETEGVYIFTEHKCMFVPVNDQHSEASALSDYEHTQTLQEDHVQRARPMTNPSRPSKYKTLHMLERVDTHLNHEVWSNLGHSHKILKH